MCHVYTVKPTYATIDHSRRYSLAPYSFVRQEVTVFFLVILPRRAVRVWKLTCGAHFTVLLYPCTPYAAPPPENFVPPHKPEEDRGGGGGAAGILTISHALVTDR